jgi:hypothetical protein
LHDPGAVQKELQEAERQHAAGKISDEELAESQSDAVGRLTAVRNPLHDPAEDIPHNNTDRSSRHG